MRILALDIGDARIGVAISDELQIIAQALCVIQRSEPSSDIKRIKDICDSYEVEKIIIGLPITLKGEVGIQGQKVLDFTRSLQKTTSIPIVSWDERFTTSQANKVLRELNVSAKKGKKAVDSIAAAFILESYLGTVSPGKP